MVGVGMFFARLLSPKKPTPEKLTSYECGEEPTGSAWLPFNSRFYVIALIFLLFDVEMVFVFPWAIVFGNHQMNSSDPRWGWLALTEMFIFLGILVLGLAYVWAKGDLDWIKAKPVIPTTNTTIPASLYEKLNAEQSVYAVRPFTPHIQPITPDAPTPAAPASPPMRKPMFKPTFKKPGNEQ